MIYKLVILISVIFLTQDLQAQKPFEKAFKDCDEALQAAKRDIQHNSIRLFLQDAGYQALDNFDNVMDSLLLVDFNITARRNADMAWDFTQSCYNKHINRHLDSVYIDHVILSTMDKAELLLKE